MNTAPLPPLQHHIWHPNHAAKAYRLNVTRSLGQEVQSNTCQSKGVCMSRLLPVCCCGHVDRLMPSMHSQHVDARLAQLRHKITAWLACSMKSNCSRRAALLLQGHRSCGLVCRALHLHQQHQHPDQWGQQGRGCPAIQQVGRL